MLGIGEEDKFEKWIRGYECHLDTREEGKSEQLRKHRTGRKGCASTELIQQTFECLLQLNGNIRMEAMDREVLNSHESFHTLPIRILVHRLGIGMLAVDRVCQLHNSYNRTEPYFCTARCFRSGKRLGYVLAAERTSSSSSDPSCKPIAIFLPSSLQNILVMFLLPDNAA